ncbi:MAG: glycosyltransferase, partial [Pseudoflavonifractor sp.]
LLEARQPDMVVATHPLCAQLVSRYKWENGSALPLVTCITDLSVHSEWITGGTDCYLVGVPEMAQQLARKGVDPTKVVATGIPVKPEFERTPRHRGGGTRRLLIMGGGLAIMPKKDKFYEELNALPNLHTTIIAGNNKHLVERLSGKYAHIDVVGYTEHVADYMANADLMLSKPGGITLFETIASELPLLAWEPFLQQEINNARFLTRAGIGAIAAKETEDCLDAVASLIHNDGALAWMSGNMRRLKSRLEKHCLAAVLETVSSAKGACA